MRILNLFKTLTEYNAFFIRFLENIFMKKVQRKIGSNKQEIRTTKKTAFVCLSLGFFMIYSILTYIRYEILLKHHHTIQDSIQL